MITNLWQSKTQLGMNWLRLIYVYSNDDDNDCFIKSRSFGIMNNKPEHKSSQVEYMFKQNKLVHSRVLISVVPTHCQCLQSYNGSVIFEQSKLKFKENLINKIPTHAPSTILILKLTIVSKLSSVFFLTVSA